MTEATIKPEPMDDPNLWWVLLRGHTVYGSHVKQHSSDLCDALNAALSRPVPAGATGVVDVAVAQQAVRQAERNLKFVVESLQTAVQVIMDLYMAGGGTYEGDLRKAVMRGIDRETRARQARTAGEGASDDGQ